MSNSKGKVNVLDFEFFTFITGVKNKEQNLLINLVDSFPYKKTHKINIIDKSQHVRVKFKKGKKTNYTIKNDILLKTLDFNFEKWRDFINKNNKLLNIIYEDDFYSHAISINNIIYKHSTKKYIIILDSDIEFINDKYLSDIVSYINKFTNYKTGRIGAIGEIYQESAFSIPLKKILSHDTYKFFYGSKKFKIKSFFKHLLLDLFIKSQKKNIIHKLPRLNPILLTLNRELFAKNMIKSKHLWFEVFDKSSTDNLTHKVMGDSGASILNGIAEAGLEVIHIRPEKYVLHEKAGSR